MKKNNALIIILIIIILLLILSFSTQLFLDRETKKRIDEDLSIQNIINNAAEKDKVILSEGIYDENIIIDKELTLIGTSKEKTIIDGNGKDSVITINNDQVILQNLTIRHSGGKKEDTGIRIKSNDNIIDNCILHNTRTGICLDHAKNNVINNCFFQSNAAGIYCDFSEENYINRCQLRNNAFAIFLKQSKNEIITRSYIHNNGLGIYEKNSEDTQIYNCMICDNNQDGGGIWSFDSTNLLIKNSSINHNGAGIFLSKTKAAISSCDFYENMYNALRLINLEKGSISQCNIIDSHRTALYIENSNCDITNNNIYDNRLYGVKVDKRSNLNIKNNYWGSPIGPSYTSFGKGDRISYRPIKNKIFPWKTHLFENIGSRFSFSNELKKKDIIINKNIIIPKSKDTDNDNTSDSWEDKWGYNPYQWNDHLNLDPDQDGLNNIEECFTDEYGSNPFYKDIFIEVDYSKGNKPSSMLISKAEKNFLDHEINLHIDTGSLEGGEQLPVSSLSSCETFQDIYWDYFLHNDIDNPRKGVFHYAIIVDCIEELYSGFVFVGMDHLDTIGLATQDPIETYWFIEKDQIIVGGIIHELGHSMGILIDDHGGIDNHRTTKMFSKEGIQYRNYKSCLNYRYVYRLLDYSDGNHGNGDFNDWNNLDFRFFKDTTFEQE